MIIPAKIREQLGDLCIVTKGLDNCWLFTPKRRGRKFLLLCNHNPPTKAACVALKRFVFGSAAELEYDKQGRVLIPVPLREYASLDKQAVIVCAGITLKFGAVKNLISMMIKWLKVWKS